MSYKEIYEKREKLIEEADNISSEIDNVAISILMEEDKCYERLSIIFSTEYNSGGITFDYYYDSYDRSKGTDCYFISADKINKRMRLNKIKKIQEKIKKNAILQKKN